MTTTGNRPGRGAVRACFVAVLLWLGAPGGLARADTLVVLNKAEASASLIDLRTGKVAATVPTGDGPHEVAVSPDGRLAVATNYGSRGRPGSSLTVIDVARASVVRTISLGRHRRPHGIQFTATGKLVVVTVEDSRAILCVDVESGRLVGSVTTDQDTSHMVTLSPDGKRAFVANIGSGSVTVVDLPRARRIRSIPTGDGAEGIDITPDGRHVWVTNRGADTVSVMDARTLKIVDTVESRSFPIRATITPDGKHVLVSNARTATVTVYDTRTRKRTRTVTFESGARDASGRLFGDRFGDSSVPIGIVVHPSGKRAFVAHANADVISVIDLKTWKPVGTLRAGKEPDGMAHSTVRVAD